MEIWKPIEITKGFIEISNKGRVRSLLRGTPCILKAQTDKKGYLRVREAECYVDSRHISDVLKGKRRHVKGWVFEYDTKGGDSNSYSYLTEAK